MALRQRRLWDWRMLVSLAMVIAVGYIVASGIGAQVTRNHERAAEAARTQALLGQIHSLVNQIDRLENTQQRTTGIFEDNQHRMLSYTQAANARQTDLLRYLREHGIHLPVRFLTPVRAPRLRSVPHHHRTQHHHTRSSGGRTPPAGPGKSGTHRHHPFSGHRHHRP